MEDFDHCKGQESPTTRHQQPEDNFAGSLSPAEAAFAYGRGERENITPHRSGKLATLLVDSRLNMIADEPYQQPLVSPLDSIFPRERHMQPLVSPLESVFTVQQGRGHVSTSSASKITQLTPLAEHIKEVVPIFAELRTNVIVSDEFMLVTELSRLLANIYACSHDGIMVHVDHSACLMLASSFDPAYVLNVTTNPNLIEYDINTKNTYDLQRLMQQMLGVPLHRGLILYKAILEENVGMTGTTVAHLNHRSPRQLYTARQAVSPAPDTAGFVSQSDYNPIAPAPASANHVLRQQISSMTEPGRKSSIRSEVSSLRPSELSPRIDSFQEFQHTASNLEHRRHKSEMALNFHKPRPISTYSSRFREGDIDWRPTPIAMPTPGNEDHLTFFPSDTESSHTDDETSADSRRMPPPPPIPHSRAVEENTRIINVNKKRRSLFAVFRKG